METGCTVEMDNTLLFIGNDGLVYRLGDVPERLSDHGIEERIRGSGTHSAFGFEYEGHKFFFIRLDEGTWGFDIATGQWCENQSFGRDNWRVRCAVNAGTIVHLGDDENGTVWGLANIPADGGATLESRWTAGFHIPGGSAFVDNLLLDANVGMTEHLTGQGENPQVEIRTSRDGGITWGTWRSAPLGAQGRYRNRARWTRLGMFNSPGAMFEFRITDPAPRRVSGVFVNERGGGRSR